MCHFSTEDVIDDAVSVNFNIVAHLHWKLQLCTTNNVMHCCACVEYIEYVFFFKK